MKQAARSRRQESSEVFDALKVCLPSFGGVAIFSAVVNILALTGSIYMLQLYDRVLSSRSISTLIGLSLIVLAAYVLQGGLDAHSRQDAGPHRRAVRRDCCPGASSTWWRRCLSRAPKPPRACSRSAISTRSAASCRAWADSDVRHAVHADLLRRLFHHPSLAWLDVGHRRHGHHRLTLFTEA